MYIHYVNTGIIMAIHDTCIIIHVHVCMYAIMFMSLNRLPTQPTDKSTCNNVHIIISIRMRSVL